jgi:hypothetical protein
MSRTEITTPQATRQQAYQAAIQKRIAHYQRLRQGQANRMSKRHKARLNALRSAEATLTSMGAMLPSQAYLDRLGLESKLWTASTQQLRERRNAAMTREQEIEWQMSFAKQPLSAEQVAKATEAKVRPAQEKPVKPERKYVSVRKSDLDALYAAIKEHGVVVDSLQAVIEQLAKLVKA